MCGEDNWMEFRYPISVELMPPRKHEWVPSAILPGMLVCIGCDSISDSYVQWLSCPGRAPRLSDMRAPDLPDGLCGNREDHDPHMVTTGSLAPFRCTADQSARLPYRWQAEGKGKV